MNLWATFLPSKNLLLLEFTIAAYAGLVGVGCGVLSLLRDPSYEVATAVGIAASVSLVVGTRLSDYPLSLWVKGVGRIVSYQRARADKLRSKVDEAMSHMSVTVPEGSAQASLPSLLFRVCLKAAVFLTLIGIQGGLAATLWTFVEVSVGVAHPSLYLGYLALSIFAFVLAFSIHFVIFADIELSTRQLERRFDKIIRVSFPVARTVARTNMIRDAYEATEYHLSKVLRKGSDRAASASTM